jgi:hypothetical protein
MDDRRTAGSRRVSGSRTDDVVDGARTGEMGDGRDDAGLALHVGAGALQLLAAVAAVLVVVSLTGQVLLRTGVAAATWFYDLAILVDLDHEANIPSWFQTGLLLLCAGVLWTTGDLARRSGEGRARGWHGLALIFAYLSLDEAASLHENLIVPLREGLGLDGVLTFAWVLVGGPLALLVALAYLPFLRALPRATARRMVGAGAVYLAGALLVELLGGQITSLGQDRTVLYAVVTTVEEVLEMSGLLLLLRALHLHVDRSPAPVR